MALVVLFAHGLLYIHGRATRYPLTWQGLQVWLLPRTPVNAIYEHQTQAPTKKLLNARYWKNSQEFQLNFLLKGTDKSTAQHIAEVLV